MQDPKNSLSFLLGRCIYLPHVQQVVASSHQGSITEFLWERNVETNMNLGICSFRQLYLWQSCGGYVLWRLCGELFCFYFVPCLSKKICQALDRIEYFKYLSLIKLMKFPDSLHNQIVSMFFPFLSIYKMSPPPDQNIRGTHVFYSTTLAKECLKMRITRFKFLPCKLRKLDRSKPFETQFVFRFPRFMHKLIRMPSNALPKL